MTRLHFGGRLLPAEESALVRILEKVGITIEEVTSPTQRKRATETWTRNWPDCWSLELTDPVHNFTGSSYYFERYVEQAGLVLYDILNKPGGAHGAWVGLIVGKPKPRKE